MCRPSGDACEFAYNGQCPKGQSCMLLLVQECPVHWELLKARARRRIKDSMRAGL